MDASTLRAGTYVDGKRIRQAIDTHETVWERRKGRTVPTGTQPVRRVTFVDGTTATYALVGVIPQPKPSRPVPGAPTALRSKLANSAMRVRASDPRWAGESGVLGDLRTYDVDLLSRTNMYDQGRVNGTVGVAR